MTPRALLLAALVAVSGLYALYGLGMYALQDAMIFPAPGGVGRDALDLVAAEQGAVPFHLEAEDGVRLYGWHRAAGGDRLLIYFHGNGETLAGNLGLHRLLARAGWDVLAVAYRGYPGSEGRPSEAGLRLDARATWRHATQSLGFAPHRVAFHGRSLGGGVAIGLATESNPAAMVLESTFHSVLEIAEQAAPLLPVSWLLRHPFPSYRDAPRAGVPALLLHSRDDGLIPIDHARRLVERFAEGALVETEGHTHQHALPVVDRAVREAYLDFLEARVPRRAR